MRFNYQYFEGKFLPIISLQLKGREGWLTFNGFVDTGASYSIFHYDVIEVLGLSEKDGQQEEMIIGDGDKIIVNVFKIQVSIAGETFFAKIGFSKQLAINMYIIGRKDIFEYSLVSFNEHEKWTEFRPLKDK